MTERTPRDHDLRHHTIRESNASPSWAHPRESGLVMLARNVSTRYVLIVANVLIGLVMVRYNVHHLGSSAYGLWMLAASVTTYFTALDFGYGSAVVRFVAEFRVRRDARALNEILSTMAYVYSALGALCGLLALVAAAALPYVFNLESDQVATGRFVFLLLGFQVAIHFPFAIFGGVVNGFERYYLNNAVGLASNVAAAAVNVAVLWLGYGLVELVAATTVMRVAPLWIYRRNAYSVFPELRVRREYFRRDRLRELSGFSVYVAVVEWAGRVTFTVGPFFLGIFFNTAAVAFYSIAQRIADVLFTLSQQLHTFLTPAVVSRALGGETDQQRLLLVRATRFQLAVAVCLCGSVAAVADGLVVSWLGPAWSAAVPVTQLLCLVVVFRALVAMPVTVLLGAGHHKYAAAAASWSAASGLAVSVPLVKVLGVSGAALGALAATIVGVALVFPRACRVVHLRPWHGCRQIAWPTLWPAFFVIGLLSLTRDLFPAGLIPVLARLGAGAALYVALFLLFGLDRDEQQWLKSAFNRISRREPRPLPAGEAIG